MSEFTILLHPVPGGNASGTDSGLYVTFYNESDGWSVECPMTPQWFIGSGGPVFGGGPTPTPIAKVDVTNADHLPEKIRLRIDGDDLFSLRWVTVVRVPAAGEPLSTPSVAVFDFGQVDLSTDSGEGQPAVDADAADLTAPTGVWDDYLFIVETGTDGAHPGTGDNIYLTLYDVNGTPVSAEYRINDDLGKAGMELYTGSTAVFSGTLPSPTWNRGAENPPTPVFLDIRTGGTDEWDCERVWVLSRQGGTDAVGRTALARFEIGRQLSTDTNEGTAQVSATAQGYHVENVGEPHRASETVMTYAIANAAKLTAPSDPVSVEISRGFDQSISLTEASGDKNSNSIEVGAQFGYNPPSSTGGATAKYSINYKHTWESWKSKTGVSVYHASKSESMKASFSAKAETIRIGAWAVTHDKVTIQVSNGFGDPVALDLVPADGLTTPSDEGVDISKDHPIARADWEDWKKKLVAAEPGLQDMVKQAEHDITELGWFAD